MKPNPVATSAVNCTVIRDGKGEGIPLLLPRNVLDEAPIPAARWELEGLKSKNRKPRGQREGVGPHEIAYPFQSKDGNPEPLIGPCLMQKPGGWWGRWRPTLAGVGGWVGRAGNGRRRLGLEGRRHWFVPRIYLLAMLVLSPSLASHGIAYMHTTQILSVGTNLSLFSPKLCLVVNTIYISPLPPLPVCPSSHSTLPFPDNANDASAT